VGGNVVWPVSSRFNLSLLGEANGRFSSIRASHQTGEISIEPADNEMSAPGQCLLPLIKEETEARQNEKHRFAV
jgi:hypothetical protein